MNFLPSVLRTVVPLIVGALITIGIKAGFNIDEASVTPAITALVTAIYYVVVRYLETHASSQFGWLLGLASQPVYVPPVTDLVDNTDDALPTAAQVETTNVEESTVAPGSTAL